MRITFFLPYASIAGGVRVSAIYAQRLSELGHEVTVVSMRGAPRPSFGRRLVRKMRNPHMRLAGKPKSPQLDFLGGRHVILDQYHPLDPDQIPDADVIIATWWETAFAVAALPPSKGRKFYFVQHHEVHKHLPAHITAGSYYLPLKKITISKWLLDIMADEYGDTDVAFVPNSVDMDMFHAPERPKNARPTVGLLYATNPFKGVDISLEAIRLAQQQIPDLKVVTFGAKRVAPTLPLPDGSDFHHQPPQQSIRDIYAACDVWLMGSRNEGFGLPLLEAMACRTPVISTPTGAAPDLIDDGVTGYQVPVEDAQAMADRIVQVLSFSAAEWQGMSDAAYARARSYTWDDATRKLEAALQAP